MEEPAIGIDAGTSNSVIGVYQSGKVEIVPNSIGDTYTPSVVDILDEGEYVGEETMLHKIDANNSKNRITEIKRIIGKKYSEIEDLTHINFNIVSNNDNIQIKVNRKGKEELFTPEEIMSLIFKKLIKNASDFVKSTITKAVITVPANYSYNQRSAIVKAANLAGIEVLRTINEPTAAALAYGLGTKENNSDSLAISIIKKDNVKNRKVLVFDLGGGTFDVTILVMQNNIFNVEATKGDTHLGGNDFDNILVDYCIKDFCQKMNVNENDIKQDPNSLRRLKAQCEKAKKKLSNNDSSSIRVYNFYNNMDLSISISRERFNQECEDLYKRIELILDEAIKD
jgi:molecular chaperone DnaK (HSP70)